MNGPGFVYRWTNGNNRTCNSISITDDDVVESEEVFMVSLVQITESSMSLPAPDLSPTAMVMIMDDDGMLH